MSSISDTISNLNSYSAPSSSSATNPTNSATGSLSATGIGSGINATQLIAQLIAVDQAPINQLNTDNTTLQSQITAYGQLSGAVSTFQIALGALTDPSAYTGLNATPSNSSVLSASAGSSASAGNYNIAVSQLATAETLVTPGQSSATAAIGSGASTTVSFQFGSTSNSGSGTTFTQDAAFGGGSLTIDSSDNSLQGIANAINAAGVGVTASVINDGSSSPWRLSLTSQETGANSTMKITVSGDSALTSLLAQDPAGTQNLTETQAGANASLMVNGLPISSPSNTLTQAIQGVSMTLAGVGSSTLSVAPSTSGIAANVQAFVSAYNTLDAGINQLTADANATAGTSAGPLAGQFPALEVQQQLRRMLGQTMVGPSGQSVSLTDLGVSFQKDGTLSLNSATLNALIQSNPGEVGALFAQSTVATDKNLSVSGTTSSTVPGAYAVSVSHLATSGSLTGKSAMPSAITITAGQNDGVNVSIDGVMGSVTIPAGTYTQSAFEAALQGAINGNSTLAAAGKSVTVATNADGAMSVSSSSYGSGSFVSLFGSAIDTAFGGASNANFVSGTDVAGTIDGMQAVGSGQTLSSQSGNSSGLQLKITGGGLGPRGMVSMSSGLANSLNGLANSFASSSGTLMGATSSLQATITENNSQITRLNAQIALEQTTLQTQFTALDTTIAQLNNTQSYLTSEFNSMAATQGYIDSSGSSSTPTSGG